MPKFKCSYRNRQGQLIQDTRSAGDREEVIRNLREQNNYPISVEDMADNAQHKVLLFMIAKPREVAVFTRQLANLLSAGVELPRALAILADYAQHPLMKEVLGQLQEDVHSGDLFWQALTKHPQYFSKLYVSMVKAGETGESLIDIINHLADYIEQRKETQDIIISMLIYPVMLFVIGSMAILFILMFVIPRMTFLFEALSGNDMPWVTRTFVIVSLWMVKYGWVFIIGSILGVCVFFYLLTKEKWRKKWDAFVYTQPYIGTITQKIVFIRFTQVLNLVLSKGVSVIEGLRIAQDVVQNLYAAEQLSVVLKRVEQGGSLSGCLNEVGLFDPLMVSMLATGEETGQLEETMQKSSDIYHKELREHTRRYISILEPLLILIMAIGVTFIVTAILMPIFQMDLHF